MLAPTETLPQHPPSNWSGDAPTESDDGAADNPPRSLVFRAGGRVYACDVKHVREVVPLRAVTRIPGAPSCVLGLISVRGAIVTVLDAGSLLHRRPGQRDGAMVMLVDCGPRGVGLAVECVTDVRALRTDEEYQELDVRAVVTRVVSITEE